MRTIIALLIASITVLVNGLTPAVEQLKNDFIVKPTNKGNRLAGILYQGNRNKCDLVRPKIRTFGYCWDDQNVEQGIDTTQERGWVREVIQQWEKCGGIQIVEEKECRVGPDFVTVHVGNYGPVVYPHVDTVTCTIEGFDMNLDFYTFGINIESYRTTEKVRKSNIQMYALHEFGHFLGFDHEHNRSDRQECYWQIDKSNIGPDAVFGTYAITKQYDLDSIMNYCRPNVHYKPYLSIIDKEGVKIKYGGGNDQECDAVTQPWTWGPGEGLEDYTLKELQKELNGDGSGSTNNGNKPNPGGCADKLDDCESRAGSCPDEAMKYWCPKTCHYCSDIPAAAGGCADKIDDCANRAGSCPDEAMKYWCPNTCKYC